jgi:hypothetical protein
MNRIGHFKAESHAAELAAHLSKPLAARLQSSWDLFISRRDLASTAKRTDDPSAFYDRARALGLYRP